MSDDALTDPGGVRLRRVATGLLVAMVGVYAVARSLQDTHWAWGYVRAFAEAAMIGGLADWFAVTAIFRRPFGLPIPHTAVIPRNQDRIADSIGTFIATNFLSPDLVRERMQRTDITLALARWLAEPGQANGIAESLTRAAPAVLDTLDEEAVSAFVRRQAQLHKPGASVAPAAGMALESFVTQGRHQALIDAALKEAWRLLEANEEALRARVRENTGWLWRVIQLDARAADAMVKALEETLAEAARDPNHPLRTRIAELLHQFGADLRNSPELHARVQQFIEDLLDQPSAAEALGDLWRSAKQALRDDCVSPDSRLRATASELIVRIASGLAEDEAARAALNQRLTAMAVDLAARHGADVAQIVAETIKGWDVETVTAKLEQGVGRDLQFIRLNGTLIGGLIGVGLHAGFELVPWA